MDDIIKIGIAKEKKGGGVFYTNRRPAGDTRLSPALR
jgi:hypothetical protein